MIRRVAKTLPIINDTLIEKPKIEGWYWCKYFSWNMDKKDYIELFEIFFFDGINFRTSLLVDYDASDWIFEVVEIVKE